MISDITLNEKHVSKPETEEFEALIRQASLASDIELWLNNHDGAALCALMNANGGWLMFLRDPGDPGSSSRNSAIGSNEDAKETYRLANGQEDEYPRHWTFSRASVFDAVREFFRTGQRPASLDWHEDT